MVTQWQLVLVPNRKVFLAPGPFVGFLPKASCHYLLSSVAFGWRIAGCAAPIIVCTVGIVNGDGGFALLVVLVGADEDSVVSRSSRWGLLKRTS